VRSYIDNPTDELPKAVMASAFSPRKRLCRILGCNAGNSVAPGMGRSMGKPGAAATSAPRYSGTNYCSAKQCTLWFHSTETPPYYSTLSSRSRKNDMRDLLESTVPLNGSTAVLVPAHAAGRPFPFVHRRLTPRSPWLRQPHRQYVPSQAQPQRCEEQASEAEDIHYQACQPGDQDDGSH
jgi:hypothetical protein